VLGQQVVQHPCILHGNVGAQDAQHPGRHAEIEPDAVRVARSRPGAGANDHLVLSKIGHDLIDHGEDRGPPAVDHTLAADLDHVGVGQNRQHRLGICLGQQRLVRQRPMNERGAKLGQELVLHDPSVSYPERRR
jgi:hypothetical protein